jgi:hypothetical protein
MRKDFVLMRMPCPRYDKASEMLAGIENENDLSPGLFRSILESVHVEGIFNNTLYSNIFDLKNGVIYLYHKHQYNESVVLKVGEELARKRYNVRIKELFSKETVATASKAYFGSIFLLCISIILGTVVMVLLIQHIMKRRRPDRGVHNV